MSQDKRPEKDQGEGDCKENGGGHVGKLKKRGGFFEKGNLIGEKFHPEGNVFVDFW